jgi:hypothetical protein
MVRSKAVIVGGLVLAIAAFTIFYTVDIFGNTTTELKLEMSGSACAITTPINDKDVTVKKNKKITWEVENACSTDQFVSVGNVRAKAEPNGVNNCNAGVPEPTWPFKAQDQARRAVYVPAGKTEKIELKEAKNDSGKQDVYYFDICVGGAKKDPRLVVDPY